MNALFGIIHLNSDKLEQWQAVRLADSFKKHYAASVLWQNDSACLGAHISELARECLTASEPLQDDETGLIIVSDAIIDNRSEIGVLLSIDSEQLQKLSESEIIMKAYKAWGNQCVDYLVGDFVFVIYNPELQTIECYRDHVGKHLIYYRFVEDTFIFSSNMKGILRVLPERCPLNDAWIADFLSMEGPIHEVDCGSTVFEGIKQLKPASYLVISQGSCVEHTYWVAVDCIKRPLVSDREAEEGLLSVLGRAVDDRIQSSKPIGILLSGGLDSTTVAALAAKKLNEQHRKLNAYSSVPLESFKRGIGTRYIANETEYIRAFTDMYPNIESFLNDSGNRNSTTDLDQILGMLEQPYRFVENGYWVDELARNASKDGCGIVLNGQYGNATISFGEMKFHVSQLLRSKRFLLAIQNLKGYFGVSEMTFKESAKFLISDIFPLRIMNTIMKTTNVSTSPTVNQELAEKMGVKKRMRDHGIGDCLNQRMGTEDVRRFNSSQRIFSQINGTYAKLSLEYGVVFRDPTMDRRVIEYCFSLLDDQFVRKGRTRDLIRRATIGLLPDKVRLNYNIKGYQSADWVFRLEPHGHEICTTVTRLMDNPLFRRYINKDVVQATIDRITTFGIKNHTVTDLRLLVLLLIFGRFVEIYETETYRKEVTT